MVFLKVDDMLSGAGFSSLNFTSAALVNLCIKSLPSIIAGYNKSKQTSDY